MGISEKELLCPPLYFEEMKQFGDINMAKGDKPQFIIRARQEPESEYMTTVGSAWKFKKGDGYVVKIHSMPVNWDGSFIMVPPYEKDDEAA